MKSVKMLIPFSTTYLCELGSSALNDIKTYKRERLRALDEEMRVAMSAVAPRIGLICSTKQAQISH
jgi:hypothetical protein